MRLDAGTHLGSYEIVFSIGAGGMGEVYRARDAKLGRDVAIKGLPEFFATNPDRLGRFEREAKLLASLNHANIAAVYGFETEQVGLPRAAGFSPRGAAQAETCGLAVDVLEDEDAESGAGQAERTFRVSVPRELFVLDGSLSFFYDVMPDGEGFLNTSSEETEAGDGRSVANEFIVTLNFFEELKRLAPAGKN